MVSPSNYPDTSLSLHLNLSICPESHTFGTQDTGSDIRRPLPLLRLRLHYLSWLSLQQFGCPVPCTPVPYPGSTGDRRPTTRTPEPLLKRLFPFVLGSSRDSHPVYPDEISILSSPQVPRRRTSQSLGPRGD